MVQSPVMEKIKERQQANKKYSTKKKSSHYRGEKRQRSGELSLTTNLTLLEQFQFSGRIKIRMFSRVS